MCACTDDSETMKQLTEKYTVMILEEDYPLVEKVALFLVNKTLAKPQLTYKEAIELYGQSRVKDWISAKLLKPVSQNGRGAKVYYSHKAIIKLSEQSRTNLKKLASNS